MDHLLLVNAAAGSAEREAVAAAREVLAEVGAVSVTATEDVEQLDAALRDAGPRRVVVCGGDGSLHLAVSRSRALGLPVGLGLVPLGTGNDLARGVGLPLDDPAAAARRVAAGHPHDLDLLVADDGQVCVNALHAGVGADAAARAAALKEHLGDLAYPVGAVLAGLAAEGVELEVTVDGRTVVAGEVLLVAVCNGPSFGGGAEAAPDARFDDGWLDVVVTTAVGAAARAAFGVAFARGEHLGRDDTVHARGREVTIEVRDGRGEELRFRDDVDGEVGAPFTRRRWRVEPAAWQLVH